MDVRVYSLKFAALAILVIFISFAEARVFAAAVERKLNIPDSESDPPPKLLSQTGVFRDLNRLAVVPGFLPYDLNLSFWSDGASKHRWIWLPPGNKITFDRTNEWKFPDGTVFVKTFELPVNDRDPKDLRRLETRLLIPNNTGGVYGVTYKWRPDNSDADLLSTNLTEAIAIQTASGIRTQNWYYPSRSDCKTCHTPLAGGVLGVNARQLNKDVTAPNGKRVNQLRQWNEAQLFDHPLSETDVSRVPALAEPGDTRAPLEKRVKSWLDVNCAYCHRPGGTVANFDARLKTPLPDQGLVDGPILIDEGIDSAKVISPKDIWRSILFMRVDTTEAIKMPPLARNEIDVESVQMLRQWIDSLPARESVIPPPTISPNTGNYTNEVAVTMSELEPGALIHYTTDGSVPTKSDPVYKAPLKIKEPTVIRAKAYKSGFTKSITTQQVYTFDN